ncbi:kinesin-like protein KIF22 isoform X2 [Narcine bancroftii]|uniref:kinesin-like protein KIF22 isoform X2 n=1 Tax=Narcine bancroftii TaxID=1343680 RepID=UPI00383146C0
MTSFPVGRPSAKFKFRATMSSQVTMAEGKVIRRAPGGRVQVAVRLRPSLGEGESMGQQACVRGVDTRTLEIMNWRNRDETVQYNFDAFYGDDSSQQEVYVGSVKPVLAHVLNGQNASVFAYGPTGAGKTHTMLGNTEQPGVIPRALLDIFRMSREQSGQLLGDPWTFAISMSYLEIYQEKVLDLLEPQNLDLPIREDRERNIFIPNLCQQSISNFADFESHFLPALRNRTTASTKLNARSSRSHSVLLLKVVKMQQTSPFRQLTGKLYLIDLAGSEDNRKTGNKGIRLKESGAINASLFVLNKVVDALNQGLSRIPYRDSKLTRLLQDSLGGSAHSVMITNIAPETCHYFNTLSALNFAAKSKLVVNYPFTLESTQPVGVRPPKRPHQEDPMETTAKVSRQEGEKDSSEVEERPLSSLLTSDEVASGMFDAGVLERVSRLERLLQTQGRSGLPLLDTPRSVRERMLQTLERLEQRQKELELAVAARETMGGGDGPGGITPATGPVTHRKQATIHRKQAIVTPLQRLDNTESFCTGNVLVVTRKGKRGKDPSEGLCVELMVDRELEQKRNEHILHILNHGSLRELKTLQRVGEKTARVILGWREQHGAFQQIEDLSKLGMSARFIATFMKREKIVKTPSNRQKGMVSLNGEFTTTDQYKRFIWSLQQKKNIQNIQNTINSYGNSL